VIASVHRRLGIATTAALIVGLMAVTPASAYVPPIEGGSLCQSVSGGYSAKAVNNVMTYVPDGRVMWDLCVDRTSSGTHFGIARLTAVSWTGDRYFYPYNVDIYLQSCSSWSYVASYRWVDSGIPGTLSNGWYNTYWVRTPSTSSSGNSFRILISSTGSVAGGAQQIELQPGQVGSATRGYASSGCMAP